MAAGLRYRQCVSLPAAFTMTFPRVSIVLAASLAASLFTQGAFAKGPLPEAPSPTGSGAPAAAVTLAHVVATPRIGETTHRLWDKENTVLFVATGALSAADFAITRSNLQSGGQELNPVVRIFGRSTAGLAVNFVGETAGVVAVSYFFHKTGHHKLERALTMVNLGGSAFAVSYGAMHR